MLSSAPVTCFLSLLVAHGFVPNAAQDVDPGGAPNDGGHAASSATPSANPTARPALTSSDTEPKFEFIPTPDGGVNITVTVPSTVLVDYNSSVFQLKSRSSIKHCVPFSSSPPSPPDSALAFRSALVPQLPLSDYCVQLSCSCDRGAVCRPRPRRCRSFTHRAGIDMDAWTVNVSDERLPDTDAGPALSLAFIQIEHKFDSLLLEHYGCSDGQKRQVVLAADEVFQMNANCSLPYDRNITVMVVPNTWFCRKHYCQYVQKHIGPLRRLLKSTPPPVRSASPPLLLTAGVPVLALIALAVAGAGLLWSGRRHRRALANLSPAAAGAACRDNAAFAADRPSVLLLHLARSDAERDAVRALAAALRARGAAVTDSAAPEARRAPRRDATAVLSAAPASGRVLVLASPAAAAAVVSAGREEGRVFAAAVKQLAGSRLTADYSRVYQARLGADAPILPGLVPGAVYTLPEHQQELVTALVGAGAAAGQPLVREPPRVDGFAEDSV